MRYGIWRTGWIHGLGSVHCVMYDSVKVGRLIHSIHLISVQMNCTRRRQMRSGNYRRSVLRSLPVVRFARYVVDGQRHMKGVGVSKRCQYNGIIEAAVAAMIMAAPLEVVEREVYDVMKTEGIWGKGSKLSDEEMIEVFRVMMIWFGKKIIWGSMEGSVLLRVFYRLTVGLEDWKH